MSNKLKLTKTGGEELGREWSLPLSEPILVGRSHVCPVRIKKDTVSGQHLEISRVNGVVQINVLGRNGAMLNGEHLEQGAVRTLAVNDEIFLDSKERLRVDSLGGATVPPRKDAPSLTGATRIVDDDRETQAMTRGGETLATRAVTASVTGETHLVQIEGKTGVTRVMSPSDETGATRALSSSEETGATRIATSGVKFGKPQATLVEATTGSVEAEVLVARKTRLDDKTEDPTEDDETERMDDSGPLPIDLTTGGADQPTISDSPSQGDPDKTKPMVDEGWTRIISLAELERRDKLEKQRKRIRRSIMMVSAAVFASFLGLVVWVRWPRAEKWLSVPRVGRAGVSDLSIFTVMSDGQKVFVVDFPHDARLKKTEEQNGAGVFVSTYTGRDRDVPFRLEVTQSSSKEELRLSLEESASAVVKKMSTGQDGFVFQSPAEWPAGAYFFETEYPGSFKFPKLLRGTRFWRSEYDVTRNGLKWHGVLFVFRDGTKVYTLKREIPDSEWPRGKFLLRIDPNIQFYKSFVENRWESPGDGKLMKNMDVKQLMQDVKKKIDPTHPLVSEWPRVKQELDSLMVETWGRNDGSHASAVDLLKEFQVLQDRTYTAFRNEFEEAKPNGKQGEAGMVAAREKCKAVFGTDPTDRRFLLSSDLEEWSWQKKR